MQKTITICQIQIESELEINTILKNRVKYRGRNENIDKISKNIAWPIDFILVIRP